MSLMCVSMAHYFLKTTYECVGTNEISEYTQKTFIAIDLRSKTFFSCLKQKSIASVSPYLWSVVTGLWHTNTSAGNGEFSVI